MNDKKTCGSEIRSRDRQRCIDVRFTRFTHKYSTPYKPHTLDCGFIYEIMSMSCEDEAAQAFADNDTSVDEPTLGEVTRTISKLNK